MEQKLYSTEEAAKILSLHPKTVRRFIREGQIQARKIGREWRIAFDDLKAYAHAELAAPEKEPTEPEAERSKIGERIKISTVIELNDSDQEESSRISNSLIALLNCKDPAWGKSRYDFIYHPETGKARFMLYGTPAFISTVLKNLEMMTNQEEE
ncbi:MAG: helix-turn-helix domain-containing protein [Spirochaetales bacterium]|nr:helix-turn-helix domain-containing protein [Spirochaetales bacterium]